jgi:hypothetical protein
MEHVYEIDYIRDEIYHTVKLERSPRKLIVLFFFTCHFSLRCVPRSWSI